MSQVMSEVLSEADQPSISPLRKERALQSRITVLQAARPGSVLNLSVVDSTGCKSGSVGIDFNSVAF